MYTLGIETSCDETSCAVVKNGKKVLSCIVNSSLKLHKIYGGVIPEIASRQQLETIVDVTDAALKEARINLKDIGLIAVTNGPGLMGSLLVGVSFAKALSLSFNIPLLGVDHVLSHIYANFLQTQRLQPQKTQRFLLTTATIAAPFVALVISGGHTNLYFIKDFDKIELLGQTQDDACGEAFDKVAKILGLGYPGGPKIEYLAKSGNPKKLKLNCSNTKQPLNFSFSGIKTAVLYLVSRLAGKPANRLTKDIVTVQRSEVNQGVIPAQAGIQKRYDRMDARFHGHDKNGRRELPEAELLQDIAASFQETVIETLIRKSLLACELKKTTKLALGGGVAVNNRLREKFSDAAKRNNITCFFPAKDFCTDNAAMVAGFGFQLFKKGYLSDLGLDIS
ncbi:MAG: tRNA (adenosine(37)-N6)-threonylcarbamoyltransferase complex transferase subunit TsaD [Candidatus Omnitrophota bacterium]|nr:tRNA (adenosine(37)-N6)-threonylcarbamoyltransferase complex transferase subunit TsaD [Candidatus Omnitrophota bacterium]